jgi:demethylmenaquinone methyltransferase / 2-methoxy-6-polyprenyl-1,4-benzoquinol methylase
VRDGDAVLDLATGTADVAILTAEDMASRGLKGSIVGVDPSAGMLAVGQTKLEARSLTERIRLQQGDAQALGAWEDDSFDRVSMSFGIRNVEDRAAALREIHRVMRKGNDSLAAILEFALPRAGPLRAVGQFMVSF